MTYFVIVCASVWTDFNSREEAAKFHEIYKQAGIISDLSCNSDYTELNKTEMEYLRIDENTNYLLSLTGYNQELKESSTPTSKYKEQKSDPEMTASDDSVHLKCKYWFVRTAPHRLRMMQECVPTSLQIEKLAKE